MATNFEFYKDKILELVKQKKDFGIVNGEIKSCIEIGCNKQCIFSIGCISCYTTAKIEWLYAEHIEPPKLTKRERAFCEAVQTGWIIDFGGIAYWTNMEPVRSGEKWHFNSDSNAARLRDFKLGFEWLDTYQSYKVEDLLKLEVIDEVQEDA